MAPNFGVKTVIMADLWEYFKNLFRKAEESSPSDPLIHEVIKRSPEEIEDYKTWVETLVRRRLQDWLFDQYAIFRKLPEDIDEALDFLNTPSSKGFVIYFHQTQYSKRDTRHFLDFLKEKVRELKYRIQISDTRTYKKGTWIETVERHYLKPPPNFQEGGKFNQGFGNITLELVFRNENPYLLKLQATIYKDSLFHEADEFKELMQFILSN